MLSDQDIEERLSVAYMLAIASHNGFNTAVPGLDRDSIDMQILADGFLEQSSRIASPRIEIQLKATINQDIKENGNFSIQIPIKNYDDLRVKTCLPRLLVVYVLPKDKKDWLTHGPNELISRKCAFWCNLKGMPPAKEKRKSTGDKVTSKERKISVEIPHTNIFSPEKLREMMIKTSRLEDIGYGP